MIIVAARAKRRKKRSRRRGSGSRSLERSEWGGRVIARDFVCIALWRVHSPENKRESTRCVARKGRREMLRDDVSHRSARLSANDSVQTRTRRHRPREENRVYWHLVASLASTCTQSRETLSANRSVRKAICAISDRMLRACMMRVRC